MRQKSSQSDWLSRGSKVQGHGSSWPLVICVVMVVIFMWILHLVFRMVDFNVSHAPPSLSPSTDPPIHPLSPTPQILDALFGTSYYDRLSVSWKSVPDLSHPSPTNDNTGLVIFSAIADFSRLASDQVDVILTVLDSMVNPLVCCICTSQHKVVSISAQIHYSNMPRLTNSLPLPGVKTALQYKCTLTTSDDYISYVTLAFKKCPIALDDQFTFVHYPLQNAEDIAVCCRLDSDVNLSPGHLTKWLDLHQKLGVDRVVLYDMVGIGEDLDSVLERYIENGFLDIQRYHIPPSDDPAVDAMEYMHKQTIPVIDCRQRMAGYRYVLSLDLDMVLHPRDTSTLLELLEDQLEIHPAAAGFSVEVDWTHGQPERGDASKQMWVKAKPSWESVAFVYLPSRVGTASLSSVKPKPNYAIYKLSADDVLLRYCPSSDWSHCLPEVTQNTDTILFPEARNSNIPMKDGAGEEPKK